MPRVLVKTTDISHEQWLDYRKTGIGGSDAAVVCGLNPYKSKIELWADKTGRLPDKEDNEAMRTGRDLEEYVAKRFCEATGKKVRRRNAIFQHDKYDFITANVDREIVGENAGLECKTTSAFTKSDFENGEIPLYYYCQCCHYMNVMGYDRMYLAVLVLGQKFYWFTIERNESECNSLLEQEIGFWNSYIVPDVRPEPDGSDSAERTIKAVCGEYKDNVVVIFEQNETAKKLAQITEKRKALETEEKRLKQQLEIALDGNTEGFTENYKITFKPQSRTALDSKSLKAEMPEVYAKYSKTTESRVFKLSERWK